MTTVKELKEYLDTLPDDTVVSAIFASEGSYAMTASEEELELNDADLEFYEGWTSERFPEGVKPTLTIGSIS